MAESAIAEATAETLDVDPAAFQARVEEDAAVVKSELAEGTFDNPQGIVGLEYEFFAVAASDAAHRWRVGEGLTGELRRVPRRLLSLIGFEKELGLHNAEMSTGPQPMNAHGLAAQESEVAAKLSAALDRTEAEGMRLVSDGVWTIPPAGETAREYLTDSVEDGGVRIAANMSDSARYHAMANTEAPAGMRVDVPHVSLSADTVMPESLITSIQPHYQVPHADDLPGYFRYALRAAGPLLALGVNSPFLPPDLYDDAPAEEVLADAWMGNRIGVFETTMNADGVRKVRFPRDLETVEEAVDRIVEDETVVPMPVDRGERFEDRFAHFRTKHGTFWRWIRPVFGGATEAEANARIEFRPIAAQPTVRDSVAFQAAFAGAIEGMHARDHPVADLDWEAARRNFYRAVREGLDADFEWFPRRDGRDAVDDLLEAAADGLRTRGFPDERVHYYLDPLRERARRGVTPARWKHREVRDRIGAGDEFEEAVHGVQRAYLDRQRRTLLDGCFPDWLDG